MSHEGFISGNEEEDNRLEEHYNSLPENERESYRLQNWERVFDISVMDNDWLRRGEYVQATLWELKKEYIKKIYDFICA